MPMAFASLIQKLLIPSSLFMNSSKSKVKNFLEKYEEIWQQ
jgi:hypothetical protein